MKKAIDWFKSKDLSVQIILLVMIFQPIGVIFGYLLHSYLRVEPETGVTLGFVVVNIFIIIYIFNNFSVGASSS